MAVGMAGEHSNLSCINRESDFDKGASEEYQGGRNSNVPGAKGARNTQEIVTNVPGNSGKRVTGKRIHWI